MPRNGRKYIPYTPRRQIGDWRAEWFYIYNHSPTLPERVPGSPQVCSEWFVHGQIKEQEDELLKRIARLRENKVTGATVMLPWIRRQIQPLQSCFHLGFEYAGLTDPSHFSSENID